MTTTKNDTWITNKGFNKTAVDWDFGDVRFVWPFALGFGHHPTNQTSPSYPVNNCIIIYSGHIYCRLYFYSRAINFRGVHESLVVAIISRCEYFYLRYIAKTVFWNKIRFTVHPSERIKLIGHYNFCLALSCPSPQAGLFSMRTDKRSIASLLQENTCTL